MPPSAETMPQRRRGTMRKRERESEGERDGERESERKDYAPDVRRAIIDGRMKCVMCDCTFAWRKSCIRHEATHTENAKFPCATCPKVFTRQDGLRLHRCPVAQLAKVLKREELAEQAGMLQRQLAAADAQVREARRDLADRTNALTVLQEQLATVQRALATRPDAAEDGGGLRYAPAPLVFEVFFFVLYSAPKASAN
jgi:transposase-like protein